MRSLYRSNVWISRDEAGSINLAGRHFLTAYARLAFLSWEQREARYALQPKLHMLWHIVDTMVAQTVSFDWIENPMAQSCAMDEDFIGRFCVLTRSVSPRLRVQRAMERYLTQVLLIWMRSRRSEKSLVAGWRMWEGVGFVWLFCSFLVDRLVSSHVYVRFYLLM